MPEEESNQSESRKQPIQLPQGSPDEEELPTSMPFKPPRQSDSASPTEPAPAPTRAMQPLPPKREPEPAPAPVRAMQPPPPKREPEPAPAPVRAMQPPPPKREPEPVHSPVATSPPANDSQPQTRNLLAQALPPRQASDDEEEDDEAWGGKHNHLFLCLYHKWPMNYIIVFIQVQPAY